MTTRRRHRMQHKRPTPRRVKCCGERDGEFIVTCRVRRDLRHVAAEPYHDPTRAEPDSFGSSEVPPDALALGVVSAEQFDEWVVARQMLTPVVDWETVGSRVLPAFLRPGPNTSTHSTFYYFVRQRTELCGASI